MGDGSREQQLGDQTEADLVLPLTAQIGIVLHRSGTNGEHRFARENSTSPEEPSVLPVREAQLGAIESELAIDPPGESVAHERRIDLLPEPPMLGLV